MCTTTASKPKGFKGFPVLALLLVTYITMFGMYIGILGYALHALVGINNLLAERSMNCFSSVIEQVLETSRNILYTTHIAHMTSTEIGVPIPMLNISDRYWTAENFLPNFQIPDGIEFFQFIDDREHQFYKTINAEPTFEIWKVWPLMEDPPLFDNRVNNFFNAESLERWKAERPNHVAQIQRMIDIYKILTKPDAYGPDLNFTDHPGQKEPAKHETFQLEYDGSWFFGRNSYTVKVSYGEKPAFLPANYFFPGFQELYFDREVYVTIYPKDMYWDRLWTFMTNIIIVISIVVTLALVGVCAVAFRVAVASRELVKALKLICDMSLIEDPITECRSMKEIGSIQHSMRSMKSGLLSFRQFIPQKIVDDMVKTKRAAEMHVEFRDVAIFFSDIEGFTTMVEKLKPDDLMSFLHDYLTTMSTIINNNEGTVVEYVGDAIMGAFNAPEDVPDFATKGVQSMIDQQLQIPNFSKKWIAKGIIDQPIKIRMGMHHDKCLAGIFGSEVRLKYGFTGDAVNLSARLEEVCKQYGVYTCVSCAMKDLCQKDKFLFRILDRVTVLGRTQATVLFEVVGTMATATEAQKKKSATADMAFQKYQSGDFESAKADLDAWINANGFDFAFDKLAARCAALMENTPTSWDGIVHLDTK